MSEIVWPAHAVEFAMGPNRYKAGVFESGLEVALEAGGASGKARWWLGLPRGASPPETRERAYELLLAVPGVAELQDRERAELRAFAVARLGLGSGEPDSEEESEPEARPEEEPRSDQAPLGPPYVPLRVPFERRLALARALTRAPDGGAQ